MKTIFVKSNIKMREVSNEYIRYWVEDGILHSEFKQDITLHASLCSKIIELRHEISEGKKQYWCYDFKHVTSMPRDGKEYAEKYGQDYLYASAAIVYNHLQKYIVNIFIAIKNPKIPFKAFTNKEKAVQWLKEIKEKNERANT